MSSFVGFVIGSTSTFLIVRKVEISESKVWNYLITFIGGLLLAMLGLFV